jgi:hypothetical protein
VLYALAAVMLATAAAGVCPLYLLFGLSTLPKQGVTGSTSGRTFSR